MLFECIGRKSKSTKTKNYRSISILSNFSKAYEKLMYKQIYQHFETLFFSSQCELPKGYSAQPCLLVKIEKD